MSAAEAAWAVDPDGVPDASTVTTDALGPLDGRLVPGGSFVLDAPAKVPSLWGDQQEVIWAEGEALMIAGPQGIGKTTVAQQVVLGRLGLRSSVLGWPVEAGRRRVLYLACDRPRQAQRSLARMVTERDRGVLDERLAVWTGPPPFDLAKHPPVLASMCRSADADTVVIDSLKDVAIGLVNDEIGAGYNRARQIAIEAGVEVIELHHQTKRGAAPNTPPTSLADVYGSVFLTAGAGSVLLLWGAAGDPIVELHHRKAPAEEVGPLRILHDHRTGTSSVWHAADLVQVAAACPNGLTAKAAATALFSTDRPNPAEVEKGRRKLDGLVDIGLLNRVDGDRSTATPATWWAASRLPVGVA